MTIQGQKKVRVLVVDDSPFMRKAITVMLESDPEIEVVATAADGLEGIEKTRELQPDLITLDIRMPQMDGLAALKEIMAVQPTPVIMLSSVSTEGADATILALELGAVDFVPKHSEEAGLDIGRVREELLRKVKKCAGSDVCLKAEKSATEEDTSAPGGPIERVSSRSDIHRPRVLGNRDHPIDIVVVGASTGGPPALREVIGRLPANIPVGIVVAQHMPATFTRSLADRLDLYARVSVREAVDGDIVEPGTVLIAPGGQHILVKVRGSTPIVRVSSEPSEALYRPCVDVLLESAARAFGRNTLAVVLSGMGTNGLKGAGAIKAGGGRIITQSSDTCVVYGMPRAIAEADLADHVAPVDLIADEILSYF
jgi:two-component system chemotaxis response regulator CheB